MPPLFICFILQAFMQSTIHYICNKDILYMLYKVYAIKSINICNKTFFQLNINI